MAGRDRNKVAVPAKKISKKRLFLFKVIAVLMPFLVVAFLEVILRLFGYGYDPHLFITHPADDHFMVMNPAASKKYFTDPAAATTGNFEPFKKEKDTGTLRIFVLGESTTIGYPYFHNGSFHRWLQYRLTRSLPDKKFEIINCSLTAVNSYTVLGFAREVANYQPDAVLIYTGHNEYYGALGAGSTGRISGSPAVVNMLVSLRSLKVGQLVTNCYGAVAALFSSKNPNEGKRRMEAMAADQHIPYGKELFSRGVEQFRSNMDATLKLFSDRHIPVFISNLISNEKDLRPFVSLPGDSTKLPVGERIETDASLNFSLGRVAYEKGEVSQAKVYFSRAIDLDALRFRAPHEMNEAIAFLCNKYRRNTHYVDTRGAFYAWSRSGIIGDEVVLDHVHPNLLGYALMSDAFYQSMKLEGVFQLKGNEISFRELLRDMPVTTIDSLAGAYRIAALKKGWPFYQPQRDSIRPNTFEEWLANELVNKRVNWEGAMDQAYNYYVQHEQLDKAGVAIAGLALEHPLEADYYEKAANIYGKLNDDEKAVFYFRKAFDLAPSVNTARFLFVLYFRIDQPASAMPYLDYAIANGGGPVLSNIRKLAEEIIVLEKKPSKDRDAYRMIAEKYKQMGNKVAAEKYSQLSRETNEHR